jgi:hypothetical protein
MDVEVMLGKISLKTFSQMRNQTSIPLLWLIEVAAASSPK